MSVLVAKWTMPRIERVLTSDPGMGVIRHADAGYDEAIEFAKRAGVKVPMMKGQ